MKTLARSFVLTISVLGSASAVAQANCGTTDVLVTVFPLLAAPGEWIDLVLTNNSNQSIYLPHGCVYEGVYPNPACNGTPVSGFFNCGPASEIPPGHSDWDRWDQLDNAGQQVPNGIYSFTIVYSDGAGNLVGCCPTVIIGMEQGTTYCTAVPNSTSGAASIFALGSNVVANNDLTLVATGMPQGEFGYFLTSTTQSFFVPPTTQGIVCIAGNIGRYYDNIGQGPVFSLQIDVAAVPQPQGLVAVLPGETWNFQYWYRDHNPTSTNNFTDAVSVTFQ